MAVLLFLFKRRIGPSLRAGDRCIVEPRIRNKAPKPNHLVALCSAGEDGRTRLELWVNGRHVLTGEDPDGVPRFNRFSILAGNGTDPLAARFDNLTVRSSAE